MIYKCINLCLPPNALFLLHRKTLSRNKSNVKCIVSSTELWSIENGGLLTFHIHLFILVFLLQVEDTICNYFKISPKTKMSSVFQHLQTGGFFRFFCINRFTNYILTLLRVQHFQNDTKKNIYLLRV